MTEPDAPQQSVFRQRWRARQEAGARPGELIRQPRWIDAGLVILLALFIVGAVAGTTITIERTAALPAVAQGTQITAVRGTLAVPSSGDRVEFRDASGATVDAVVQTVTDAEVTAEIARSGPLSSGELLIPAGRQRLIGMLLPRLG